MNALILSGGRSTRMGGGEKALLTLGAETFIGRLLRVLRPLFETLLISTNAPELYAGLDALMVRDETAGLGPLMGLYSGLKASGSEHTFVTAADAPLLCSALVRYLAENAAGWDVLVPVWRGYPEPLCAVYARACLEPIRESLDMRRVISFYPRVRVRYVEESVVRSLDPRGRSFLNANTPEDLLVVRREWEEGCAGNPADW